MHKWVNLTHFSFILNVVSCANIFDSNETPNAQRRIRIQAVLYSDKSCQKNTDGCVKCKTKVDRIKVKLPRPKQQFRQTECSD